jgi:hypothetical protein
MMLTLADSQEPLVRGSRAAMRRAMTGKPTNGIVHDVEPEKVL